jgi:hypothetical protein
VVRNQIISITCCKVYVKGANPPSTQKDRAAALTAETSNYDGTADKANGMNSMFIFIKFAGGTILEKETHLLIKFVKLNYRQKLLEKKKETNLDISRF